MIPLSDVYGHSNAEYIGCAYKIIATLENSRAIFELNNLH